MSRTLYTRGSSCVYRWMLAVWGGKAKKGGTRRGEREHNCAQRVCVRMCVCITCTVRTYKSMQQLCSAQELSFPHTHILHATPIRVQVVGFNRMRGGGSTRVSIPLVHFQPQLDGVTSREVSYSFLKGGLLEKRGHGKTQQFLL